MTKAAVPQGSGHGRSGKGRCAGGWEERIEVARAIAPGDPSQKGQRGQIQ